VRQAAARLLPPPLGNEREDRKRFAGSAPVAFNHAISIDGRIKWIADRLEVTIANTSGIRSQ